MLDPKNFMAFLKSIEQVSDQPDMIDFFWYSDDELLNLAFDEDAYFRLPEDAAYDLLWQIARRYQNTMDPSA